MSKAAVACLLALGLAACTAGMHADTQGPLGKVHGAYRLMDDGRFAEAENVLLAAREQIRTQPDPVVEADIHVALGNLYKNIGYHRTVLVDADPAEHRAAYSRALQEFRQAEMLFRGQKMPANMAKSLVGEGETLLSLDARKPACERFSEALRLYNDAKAEGRLDGSRRHTCLRLPEHCRACDGLFMLEMHARSLEGCQGVLLPLRLLARLTPGGLGADKTLDSEARSDVLACLLDRQA